MEKKYGFDVKPYLSGDKNKATVVEESKLYRLYDVWSPFWGSSKIQWNNHNDTFIQTYLIKALLNPSQRGHILWFIKILLTKWLDIFVHLILSYCNFSFSF